MPATNIDDVLVALDGILADTAARRSRLSLFAAMYRLVTARVRDGILRGRFADGPRMDRLDTVFALRYLDAYAAFHAGAPVSKSWQVAFCAAEDASLVGLQHLLLGVNAHINLDLGIAAAMTCPGPEIEGLRADFERINDLLAELMEGVQAAIGAASPMLATLDRFCGAGDEQIAGQVLDHRRPRAGRLRAALARRPAPRARLTVRAAADDPLRLRHESPRRDHRRRPRPQAARANLPLPPAPTLRPRAPHRAPRRPRPCLLQGALAQRRRPRRHGRPPVPRPPLRPGSAARPNVDIQDPVKPPAQKRAWETRRAPC